MQLGSKRIQDPNWIHSQPPLRILRDPVRDVGTLAVAVGHLANHVREILRIFKEAVEFL